MQTIGGAGNASVVLDSQEVDRKMYLERESMSDSRREQAKNDGDL